MSYIRNRKHASARQPLLSQSLIALAALSAPLGAHAQQAQDKPEVRMPETTVTATADVPYKADKVSSPKLTQPLVDTTQTIAVIKKEVFQEQGAGSIVEALRNTPGITLQLGENGNTSAGDTFQMRGFATQNSIFVDGIRDLGTVTRDVFNIEQIEVSKGPAGTDVGRGAAGGYINLASKVPSLDDTSYATVGIDSGSTKRVTADVNRSIGATSAFRLNVMAQDGGLMGREVIERKTTGIAPSLAFGLGTPTRLFLMSQHIRQSGMADGGLPAVGIKGFHNDYSVVNTAPRVDRENFYGYDSDFSKVDADMLTARIEHQLAPKATLTNTFRYGKSTMDRILTGVNGLLFPVENGGPSTWEVARTRQSVFQENRILANTTNVVAEFNTGAIGHTLSTGLEFMSEEQNSPTRVGLGTPDPANLYKPGRETLTNYAPVFNGAFSKGETTTAAVYAFDTLKLNDQWQLNAGLRAEHYNTETNAVTIANTQGALPVPTRLEKSDNLFSWKAGALYKPSVDGSIYLSFATSQTPPGSANFTLSAAANNVNGPAMDPQKTENIEFGTKWDLIQKKLAVTAALYRTTNKNEFTLLDTTDNTYSQLGERRVQGLELGVVGQVTRNWNIIAGLATMDTEILEGSGSNTAGSASRWSPKLSTTLWSTYNVNDKFTVGGGVRYTSEQKRVVDPSLPPQPNAQGIASYTVADLVARYKVSKNVSVQLNVYNLFDTFYVNTLNNGGSRAALGAPRSAQLQANIAF